MHLLLRQNQKKTAYGTILVVLGLVSASRQLRGEPTSAVLPPVVSPSTAPSVVAPPMTLPPQLSAPTTLPRVHDPVIAKEGTTYYSFSTGRGITVYSSPDRMTWQRQGRAFPLVMSWTATTIPGSTDHYWAPDISFWNGRWHLYYSVSTFGKNHSAIGLATSATLDPKRADYGWRDEGVVVESNRGDDWNAIDPNLILDEKGKPWLSLGSFWSGLKLFALDAATGKVAVGTKPNSIARRTDNQGALEAPFIIRHGDFYYLFASFDFCCRGVNSTYNIRVGRAKNVVGPYFDRDGRPMLEGGGTLILEGVGRWRGPGHNSVYQESGKEWLVYHAYDAEDNGVSKLHIQPLEWDKTGWPHVTLTPDSGAS